MSRPSHTAVNDSLEADKHTSHLYRRLSKSLMASQQLRTFLSSIDNRYPDYACIIYQDFRTEAGLETAERTDLLALGVPRGATELIMAAKGTGDSYVVLVFSYSYMHRVVYLSLMDSTKLRLTRCSGFACNICA